MDREVARGSRRSIWVVIVLLLLASRVGGQQVLDSAKLVGMHWRNIGPAVVGGRVAAIAVVANDPATFYVGTASGGVWKTTSGGASWEPIFDHEATASIGAVALAPGNANVVWVGTGEPQNRQSSPYGAGVYRSLDAGRSWQRMGLEKTRQVGRIVVDPRNPDIVYVAAVGHLWGPNPERGVYRTRDGGRTWEKVLFLDNDTGAIDLVMDPGDPHTLFAALYQRRRTAWGYNGGGPGSGIYRTLDGGDHWERLTAGLPAGDMGRIGLAIYRRDGNLVLASVEAVGDERGVYRSRDRGETWEKISDTDQRPMYFSQIRIDPNDADRVYMGGVSLWRSTDGGRTFSPDGAEGVHPDHHAIWIDPTDSRHLIIGNDGGISVSRDGGEHWRMLDNLPIAQFYQIGADRSQPYRVCGGLQDNGSWCGPSNSLSTQGIRNADWQNIGGGDGFYAQVDPSSAVMVYTESQNGFISLLDRATGERRRIRPVERSRPPTATAAKPDSIHYRWNWNTPILVSPHDPAVVYVGANVLLKSPDRGQSWGQISPDLTAHIDRDTLSIMGVKGTDITLARNDGTSFYGTLTTISESPVEAGVIYTGADDGTLQVTRDGGATWSDVTANVRGLPPHTYVSRVVASAARAGTVYASFDGHYADDYQPYIYASHDYGKTWRRITQGLPEESINVVVEHPRAPGVLFAGNEVGVFFSTDTGASWQPLKGDLPTVPVDDILIHPLTNDLILATHGRGIWIMQDSGPLEQLTTTTLAEAARLFPVAPVVEWSRAGAQAWVPGEYAAPNPPTGAYIRYYLRDSIEARVDTAAEASGQPDTTGVRLIIRDGTGHIIRTLAGPVVAGIHQVIWDLRVKPAYQVPGGGNSAAARGAQGPRVLPGTYQVQLAVAGRRDSTTIEVRYDPRIQVSRADLEARQQAMLSAFALARPLYQAGRALESLNRQLGEARRLISARSTAPPDIQRQVQDLAKELRAIATDLRTARTNASVGRALESWSGPPTADQSWQLDRAWQQTPALIRQLNEVLTNRMPALLRRVYQPAVAPELPGPIAVPNRSGQG